MVGCVEGILGMRPDFYGLHIAPSIPKAWDGFEIEKDLHGKLNLCLLAKKLFWNIVSFNRLSVYKKALTSALNMIRIFYNYIPKELLSEQTEIELTM